MRTIDIQDFKVENQVDISKLPTTFDLEVEDEVIKHKMRAVRKKLAKIQDTMYAHGKYAVLVCLQGMDTSGKDSLIREVFKDFNARGVVVHSFKVPTELELKHDYIWRHYLALPSRGKFGVFNRTHYENVLVTRVHPNYILNENIPHIRSVDDIDDAFWQSRFDQINSFEHHIAENGTVIFKFFMNLSKEEQKNRLLRRLNKTNKNWKFSPGDLKERELWDKYQKCYEDVLNRSSTEYAPWYNIPADNKATARYLVAKIMYDTMKSFDDIKEPELDEDIKANIELYKRQLQSE